MGGRSPVIVAFQLEYLLRLVEISSNLRWDHRLNLLRGHGLDELLFFLGYFLFSTGLGARELLELICNFNKEISRCWLLVFQVCWCSVFLSVSYLYLEV